MSTHINRHPTQPIADTLRQLARRAESTPEPDTYGTGALIEAFEQRLATMLGKPAALLLPSGTLAQPLALRVHADQRHKQGIGLHPTSHLVMHEQDGYQQLWRLHGHLLGRQHTVLTRKDFEIEATNDLAAVVLELPMREIGGQLPEWEDLRAQCNWAKTRDIAVHIDGARLWQCPAFYQRSLAEICALADSVYVSLYKDLGGIAGAVLAGETEFIARARVWARRAGGNLISLYPYILAAEQGLEDNLDRMPEALVYAGELGPTLAALPRVRCNPSPPQSAMFHLHIDMEQAALTRAIADYARQHDVVVLPNPRSVDEQGHSVCEINVGRSTMAHPPAFWLGHLHHALLGATDGKG